MEHILKIQDVELALLSPLRVHPFSSIKQRLQQHYNIQEILVVDCSLGLVISSRIWPGPRIVGYNLQY